MAATTDEKKKKFAIIDGKSVFYRGYYAMPNLSTPDGTPTGGVFGFATMALEVIRRLRPDYVAVAWDKPKTNIRKRLALYPEYKAGRKPAPPDFYAQIPVLHELLEAFGWPLYELDDYEADDIMGTLAVQAAQQDIDVMLITSDLDMLQLIDPHVHVYALKTGLSNIELYSPKTFEAKYGIRVDQFLDLKSLKGDSSDNIPGVPGVGEKTAVQLLQEYDTLDNIYDNVALIKDSVRKKLEAGKDLAYLSKKLGAIWTDAPLTLDLSAVDGHHVQPEQVLHLLQKLQFKSLVRQLPEIMQVAIANHHESHGTSPLNIGTQVLIRTDAEVAKVDFTDAKQIVVHSRNAGRHGRDPQLLSMSVDGSTVYTFVLPALNKRKVADLLQGKELVGYDVKSTVKVLLEMGIGALPTVAHDVLVGAFLINSLQREQTLTELAQRELAYEGSPFEDLDTDELMDRMPEIIAVIHALHLKQLKELNEIPKLAQLAHDIEWPVIRVLARMEHVGIELNTKYLATFAVEINDTISDLAQQIYGHADQEFNIASPAQLAEILFETLNLPTQGIKKGKTGYSTAASELDKLRGLHPIIDLITQYREVTKLKNTYVDTLPKQVDENRRVHTTFNLTTAQTGRLSSLDPNLQNIPTRTDLGRHIRTAFVAGEGKRLVSADYSQFELRIAAYLCGDEKLMEQFNSGMDVHQATAAEIYGRNIEDVTKQMRRDAKVVNFGVMYGLSAHGLSIATGMTREAAQNFIDRYFEVRPKLQEYIEHLKEQARNEGYVETLFGRRRPTPDIHSSNFIVRQAAERAAVNMPFQGTAADIMKMAMVNLEELLLNQHNDCNMLLQVHDSVLVECPSEVAERIAKLLKDTMEHAYELPVQLTVDTSIGSNWGAL
ncbi:MAG TPA: DNA polymerase I [Candidatus Saccharimonadales bacterium]|nr:DNA polymerase I [Candidatus Saccharimonadales bacterium]